MWQGDELPREPSGVPWLSNLVPIVLGQDAKLPEMALAFGRIPIEGRTGHKESRLRDGTDGHTPNRPRGQNKGE